MAGESAIDRFACGIGGKHMLPHIIATVPQMLQNGTFSYETKVIGVEHDRWCTIV